MTPRPEHKKYLHHWDSSWLSSFREIIFGVEDGLVSTLGVIVGVTAATGDLRTVIISGLVVIFVEAVAMGAGTYLSSKSEQELEAHFLAEEREELELYPEEEKEEVVEYLQKQGYSEKDIPMIVKHITSDKERWLRFMAVNELGFVPDEDQKLPLRDTFFMWISYIIGGFIALSAFFYIPLESAPIAAVITVSIALFSLGVVKALLLKGSWLKSGLEMLIVGLVAAGIGQLVGWLADTLII
jgi:VIT1/CCC1 family predicted Fe2+/Mn2+ transporter